MSSPPEKKAKLLRSNQKYKDSYKVEFGCLKASSISETYIFCSICGKDFSIAHGGRDDCRRHVNSVKHKEYAVAVANTKILDTLFVKNNDMSVIRAECYFARFLIEHNLPIAVADHAKPLFTTMFPDSSIATKYSSGHTKSTAIIKSMAETTVKNIISSVFSAPFSVSTDGSNDSHDVKLYPVLLTYFDKVRGKIITSLISILECTDNTGEGIFKVLNNDFVKKCLDWKNCISFGSDNASTMLGKFKGVVAFLQKHQPFIIIRGCPCHLIHLAAKTGTAQLNKINIEMLLVDIYFFLEKSSKRKNNFKVCQQMCGQSGKPHKILKYCSTRWLSLLECINRVLEQWDALKTYFCSDELENDLMKTRFVKVKKILECPSTKLYLLFLKSVLPSFTKVNVVLQQENPYVHKLRRELIELFMDLLVRFVKPSVISKNQSESNLSAIKFDKHCKQKHDENLVIGAETRMYMNTVRLSNDETVEFYTCVRNFFVTACSYILKKFPLEDPFLKHAEVADISIRSKVSFSSILYMTNIFPAMVDQMELDKLEVEFVKYQVDDLQQIAENPRTDVAWVEISKLKDNSGATKYQILPQVMLTILVVPHSNASSERIFSLVRKNQTEFRPNLSTSTLESLLIEKVNMSVADELCFQKQFCNNELKAAKRATVNMHS